MAALTLGTWPGATPVRQHCLRRTVTHVAKGRHGPHPGRASLQGWEVDTQWHRAVLRKSHCPPSHEVEGTAAQKYWGAKGTRGGSPRTRQQGARCLHQQSVTHKGVPLAASNGRLLGNHFKSRRPHTGLRASGKAAGAAAAAAAGRGCGAGSTLRSLWMIGGFCRCMCWTALHVW